MKDGVGFTRRSKSTPGVIIDDRKFENKTLPAHFNPVEVSILIPNFFFFFFFFASKSCVLKVPASDQKKKKKAIEVRR